MGTSSVTKATVWYSTRMYEQPRPDANTDERAYTLTVEEALLRYEAAGHGRTARALQKYCLRGDLDCIKEETEYGQRYRITPASVARHLEQIEQLSRTKGREQPRPDANVHSIQTEADLAEKQEATIRERSRTVANDTRYVEQLERENTYLRVQNDKKDQQLERRDRQVEAMIERDRETNILIKGLQERIPQLGAGERGSNLAEADIKDHRYDPPEETFVRKDPITGETDGQL
jgi:hypothetical protein